MLWSLLNIEDFQGTTATDLKLANILVGIGSRASTYPFLSCTTMKNELNICGEYRTIGKCG